MAHDVPAKAGAAAGHRIGIRGKMALSIAFILACSLVASAVAFIGYASVDTTIGTITKRSIPAMNQAQVLALQAERLVSLTPWLNAVETSEARNEIADRIFQATTDYGEQLRLIGEKGWAGQEFSALEKTSRALLANLVELNVASVHRLEIAALHEALVRGLFDTEKAIHDTLTNYKAEVKGRQEDVLNILRAADDAESLANASRRMVRFGEDLVLADRIAQDVTEVRSWLVIAAAANDDRQLATAQSRAGLALSDMENLPTSLPDDVDASVRAQWALLHTAVLSQDGVVARRKEQLDMFSRAQELMADNRSLSETLSAAVEKLVRQQETEVQSASTDTVQLVSASRTTQTVASITAIVASILVATLYVGKLIVMRLMSLNRAMEQISRGNLTYPVDPSGDDEIATMARAVEVFKQNAFDLRRSEARYRDLLDNLIEGVYQTYPDGRLLSVNRAMAELVGYGSPGEMVEKVANVANVFYEDAADYGRLTETLARDGFVRNFEARLRRSDGTTLFAMWNVKAVRDEYGELIRTEGTVGDITARKRAEREILELNAQLEERVRQRTAELQATLENLRQAQDELIRTEKLAGLGSLVAGIAHEINTPLGSAVTVASSMQEKVHNFSSVVESGALRRSALVEFLDGMATGTGLLNSSLHKAAELIGNFKRVAVDQTSDMRRPFDCRTVTMEVLSMLRPMTKNRPVNFDINVPEGLIADSFPGAFGQILTNLTQNAIIHGLEGKENGNIRLIAEAQDGPGGPWLTLNFSDDGCGIPQSFITRVFDPFFTTKLGKGGSGLGLHIVYTLTTQVLRGRVNVTSEPDRGTTFTISFPMVAPVQEERQAA